MPLTAAGKVGFMTLEKTAENTKRVSWNNELVRKCSKA